MNDQEVKAFLRLAKAGNMSHAADSLGISQSALSNQIVSLEQEIGEKLFDRSGNSLRLNANGEHFYDFAEKQAEEYRRYLDFVKKNHYHYTGTIYIGCTVYPPILFECIDKYLALNPNVSISVCTLHNKNKWHSDGKLDFWLFSESEKTPVSQAEQYWVSTPLFRDQWVVVYSRKMMDTPETEISDLIQLKDRPFVVMQGSDMATDVTYFFCEQAGFSPKVAVRTDNTILKYQLIGSGRACGVLPVSCLNDCKTMAPDICFFPVEGAGKIRIVYINRRKKELMNETAADFWNFLMEYYHLPLDERG